MVDRTTAQKCSCRSLWVDLENTFQKLHKKQLLLQLVKKGLSFSQFWKSVLRQMKANFVNFWKAVILMLSIVGMFFKKWTPTTYQIGQSGGYTVWPHLISLHCSFLIALLSSLCLKKISEYFSTPNSQQASFQRS